MKAFKAGMRIYLNQLLVILITIILIVPLLSMAQNLPYLFSAITTVIYGMMMYSVAWNVGVRDARNIPGFRPDIKVPLKISLITAIVPVILLVLKLALPDIWAVDLPFMKGEVDFFIRDLKIEGTTDFIFRMWYLPLAAFVPTDSLFATVAQMFVLPAIIYVGYLVGLQRFSLFEYLYARVVFSDNGKNGKTGKNGKKKENALRR